MTGMDKVLNKRIASIFLNELEAFRNYIMELPNESNYETLKFNIHKIRPSMIIFELDLLLEKYELLANRKKNDEQIIITDLALQETIKETNESIDIVREFIQSI
jgi:hypothetical protein